MTSRPPFILNPLARSGAWDAIPLPFVPRLFRWLAEPRRAMKNTIKSLAYRSGVLPVLHRLRNRDTLTVAMFHRILPAAEARALGADPEWTMSPDSLRACLRFFSRHYSVVSPAQVFTALRGEQALPANSLLITFDDGWCDTAIYAQPILDECAVPALVFVAGIAIDQAEPFWEERIFSMLATDPGAPAQLTRAFAEAGIVSPAEDIDAANTRWVIRHLGELDQPARERVLAALPKLAHCAPAMMDRAQVNALAAAGHAIGGHGMVHQPLTKVADLGAELRNAQKAVAGCLGQTCIESMSFPHGAFDDAVIAASHAAGYRFLFTSDARLNALPVGPSVAAVGRIHLSERTFTDAGGRFQPALLATSLFLRPIANLESSKGKLHA